MDSLALVEHARELREHLIDDLPNGVGNTIDALADTLERYRDALEFYANGIGYTEREDGGKVARTALSISVP